MGVFKKFSSGSTTRAFSGGKKFSQGHPPYNDGSSDAPLPSKRNPIEPDPMKFTIVRAKEKKGHTLAEVIYPDCVNFKGSKILLIAASVSSIMDLKELDPHFLEEGSKVAILARFRPTDEGWKMGEKILDSL